MHNHANICKQCIYLIGRAFNPWHHTLQDSYCLCPLRREGRMSCLAANFALNESTMTILDKITCAVKNECGNIMAHVILHISYISMFVCVLMIAMTMSQNHLAKTIGSMLNIINVACPCVSVSYSTPYKYLVFVLMTPHVALGSVAHFDWWKCATPIASCSNSE
jgi:hypothetical protein